MRFDPSSTPSSSMGILAEYVRTMPGAVRSAHPQSSFAAVGDRGSDLMRVHDLDCHLGERSPLGALYEAHASVLHLGTSYEVSTIFHLAEYRQPNQPLHSYECRVAETGTNPNMEANQTGDGWIVFQDIHLDDSDFGRLGADFERQTGRVHRNAVGNADALLFPARAAVDYAVGWMARERRVRSNAQKPAQNMPNRLPRDSQTSYREEKIER